MKTITGAYTTEDRNFTTVYTNDAKYVIASPDNWGVSYVGKPSAWMNKIYTREQHEAEKAECTKVGTFELEEE